jgi:hypothetical protein
VKPSAPLASAPLASAPVFSAPCTSAAETSIRTPATVALPPPRPEPSLLVHELLLSPILTRKLPKSVQLEWSRRVRSPRDKFNLSELLRFSKSELEALEALSSSALSEKQNNRFRSDRKIESDHNRRPVSASSAFQNRDASTQRKGSEKRVCFFCSSVYHSPFRCESFKSASAEQRLQSVQRKKLCTNCLSDHAKRPCNSVHVCLKCSGKHHTLLHESFSTPPLSSVRQSRDSVALSNSRQSSRISIFQTALVRVKGSLRRARIFIDSGSEQSYVSQSLVDDVQPRFLEERVHKLKTFGGIISKCS